MGTGTYRYLGDLNHNGLADDNEFVPARFDGDYVAVTVPTDQLFPIIDLKTGLRVRITPSRILGSSSATDRFVALFSAESYIRIEEKSTDATLSDIYLLRLRRFLNDSTTINGTRLFTQDLNVNEGSPLFSARFRFSDRKGLNSLSGGLERSYARERSIRLRWQLIPEISNQVDYSNRQDALAASTNSSRTRNISSDDLVLDFSYRPIQDIEVGMKFETSKGIDSYPVVPTIGDLNAQAIRCVYAMRGAGQLRVEFSREEMHLSSTPDIFPYDLTGGRVAGITWLWKLAFEYRVTEFLQTTLNYDGRSEGGSSPVHTGRAEVRAFF
jgi:hypothetical protein